MAYPFVTADVVRPPRVDARRGIALSLKLQQNAPDDASPVVEAAVERLAAATEALSVAWRVQRAGASPRDNRAVMRALVNAWSATYGRLFELTKLDPATVRESAEAQTLLDVLFPNVRTFLQGEHDGIWIDSRDLLAKIDDGGHADAINRLAGEVFLPAVRRAHQTCGDALGLTQATAEKVSVELKGLLDAVTAAISTYAIQLIASADASDADDVRVVTHALDPLIDHRKRARTRRNEAIDTGEEDQQDDAAPKSPTQGVAVPTDTKAANDNPAQPAPARRVA